MCAEISFPAPFFNKVNNTVAYLLYVTVSGSLGTLDYFVS